VAPVVEVQVLLLSVCVYVCLSLSTNFAHTKTKFPSTWHVGFYWESSFMFNENVEMSG